MKKSIKLQDIAESLNLSISTVSKSLNNSREISESTKARVQELAKLHKYFPNVSAQHLKGQNTRNIGVIIPRLEANFFSVTLNAIEERINARDYRLVLCISNETIKKERRCVDLLLKAQVDGIIVCPSAETFKKRELSHLKRIQNYNKALVIFHRIPDDIICDKISIDQSLMIEELILELYYSGFRRIGFISLKEHKCISGKRVEGYYYALQSMDLPDLYFEYTKDEEERIVAKIFDLIRRGKMDALIVPSFSIAMKIMDLLGEKNDQLNFKMICLSSESTKKKNFVGVKPVLFLGEEQGRTAADIVIDRIEGKLFPEPINIVLRN